MGSTRTAQVLVLGLLALGLTSCSQPKSTRWDEKAAELAESKPLPPPKGTVTAGGDLNAYFPRELDGLTRTFTQEKAGFAEAELTVGGRKVRASISDTAGLPEAQGKFGEATERLAGHPLVLVGSNQSALLVGGRWQVKVSSPDLGPVERRSLLERFDLAGLAAR